MAKLVAVIVAIAVPCYIFGALVYVDYRTPGSVPDLVLIPVGLAACTLGFALLASHYRQRSVLVGIFYFPGMVLLLFYVGLTIATKYFRASGP